MDLLKTALDVAIDSPPAHGARDGLVRLRPAPQRAVSYQFDGMPLVATRGSGDRGLNIRLGGRPDEALLTLRSPLAAACRVE